MTELTVKVLKQLKGVFPNLGEELLLNVINNPDHRTGVLNEETLIVRCVEQILEGEEAAKKRVKNAELEKKARSKVIERRMTRSFSRQEDSKLTGIKRDPKLKKKATTLRKGKKVTGKSARSMIDATGYREHDQMSNDGTSTACCSEVSYSDSHVDVSLSPKSSSSFGISSLALDSQDEKRDTPKLGQGEGHREALTKDWLAKCGPKKDGETDLPDGEDSIAESTAGGCAETGDVKDGGVTPTRSSAGISDTKSRGNPDSPGPSIDACSGSDLEIISLRSEADTCSRDSWSVDFKGSGCETPSNNRLEDSNDRASETDKTTDKSDTDESDTDTVTVKASQDNFDHQSLPSLDSQHDSSQNDKDSMSEDNSILSDDGSLPDIVSDTAKSPVKNENSVIDISDIVELESPMRRPAMTDSGFSSARKMARWSSGMSVDPLDLSHGDDELNTDSVIITKDKSTQDNQSAQRHSFASPASTSNETCNKLRKSSKDLFDSSSKDASFERYGGFNFRTAESQITNAAQNHVQQNCSLSKSMSTKPYIVVVLDSDCAVTSSDSDIPRGPSSDVQRRDSRNNTSEDSTPVQSIQISSNSPDKEYDPQDSLKRQISSENIIKSPNNILHLKRLSKKDAKVSAGLKVLKSASASRQQIEKSQPETKNVSRAGNFQTPSDLDGNSATKAKESNLNPVRSSSVSLVPQMLYSSGLHGSLPNISSLRTTKYLADAASRKSRTQIAASMALVDFQTRKLQAQAAASRAPMDARNKVLEAKKATPLSKMEAANLLSQRRVMLSMAMIDAARQRRLGQMMAAREADGASTTDPLKIKIPRTMLTGKGSAAQARLTETTVVGNATPQVITTSHPNVSIHGLPPSVPTPGPDPPSIPALLPLDDQDADLQQVIAIFPDVDVTWAKTNLRSLRAKYPDDYLHHLCSTMADNGYVKTGESLLTRVVESAKGKGKHKSVNMKGMLGKIKTSQRYADVLSEIGEEAAELKRMGRKRPSEEAMDVTDIVPLKISVMTDGTDSVTNVPETDNGGKSPSDSVFRLQCEACDMLAATTNLSQCCEGHLLCQTCVEKCVKTVLSQENKTTIICSVKLCSSEVRLAYAKKVLPQFVVDLLQEKIEKQERNSINNMCNVVRCPDCGVSVMMDPQDKQFHCPNTDCMLACCRYCKRPWNECKHHYCSPLISVPTLDNCTKFPDHWDTMAPDFDQDYMKVIVPRNSPEFFIISEQFNRSMRNHTITCLTRIQNPKLWQKYGLTRSHILEDFGPQKLNENHLFHGTTPKVVDSICKEGFDWRLCGQHGVAYGQGSYFAVEANYSHQYAQTVANNLYGVMNRQQEETTVLGLHLLLVARVTCGRYTVGSGRLRRPPPDTSDPKQRPFNSVVNNVKRPSMYVTFDNSQTYPEYVIEYT